MFFKRKKRFVVYSISTVTSFLRENWIVISYTTEYIKAPNGEIFITDKRVKPLKELGATIHVRSEELLQIPAMNTARRLRDSFRQINFMVINLDEAKEWYSDTLSHSDPYRFYRTAEWYHLRIQTLLTQSQKCLKCKRDHGVMQADHVKPRSIYPALALDPKNLQVLCKPCNEHKSNTDETDYRPRKIG